MPTISSFTIPATSNSLIVPISNLIATDNVGGSGVSDYCVMETSSSVGCLWSFTAPVNYTFAKSGIKKLYAFARDAAGNRSNATEATVTIAPQIVTIKLNKPDAAGGTVSSSPTGISCPVGCEKTYGDFSDTSPVFLTSTPATGYFFIGWSNCDETNANICTVATIANHKEIIANFSTQIKQTLNLSIIGSGSVNGAISCLSGETCSQLQVDNGTVVTLYAITTTDTTFGGWSGCTTTSGINGSTCTVKMDAVKTATATFNTAPVAKNLRTGAGFTTLQEAYNQATNNDTIMLRVSSLPFTGGLLANRSNIKVIIKDGYDAAFGNVQSGYSSTMSEPILIKSGLIVIDRLKMK